MHSFSIYFQVNLCQGQRSSVGQMLTFMHWVVEDDGGLSLANGKTRNLPNSLMGSCVRKRSQSIEVSSDLVSLIVSVYICVCMSICCMSQMSVCPSIPRPASANLPVILPISVFMSFCLAQTVSIGLCVTLSLSKHIIFISKYIKINININVYLYIFIYIHIYIYIYI